MGPLKIRTDSESAIRNVAESLAASRMATTVLETSPVGSFKSIGAADHWSQMLAAQVRVLRLDVEQRWNIKVNTDSPLVSWMVKHAEYIYNRFQPLADGKTAFENVNYKPWRGILFNMTETVMGEKASALETTRIGSTLDCWSMAW